MFVTSPSSLKGNTHGKRKRKLGYYFQDFKIQSTSDSNVWKLYLSITEMKALLHIFKWLRISFGSLHSKNKIRLMWDSFCFKVNHNVWYDSSFCSSFPRKCLTLSNLFTFKTDHFSFFAFLHTKIPTIL